MASLEEVADQLRAVLYKVDVLIEALHHGGDLAREAAELIEPVGRGSVQEADYYQVLGHWTAGATGAADLATTARDVRQRIEGYLRALMGDHAPIAPIAPSDSGSSARAAQPLPGSPVPELSWVDQQRAVLASLRRQDHRPLRRS